MLATRPSPLRTPHHDLLGWLPYGLLPSAREEGRPEPDIVEMRLPEGVSDWAVAFREETIATVQAWPVETALHRFAYQAAYRHGQARSAQPGAATLDELRQWIASTRGLAAKMPLAGPAVPLMRAAATRVENALDLPSRFFVRWPRHVGTTANTEWRVNLNLWAMDHLVRAVNEHEPAYANLRAGGNGGTAAYVSVTLAKFWPAMFESADLAEPSPAFADYKEAQKRISRLNQTVKDGQTNALMVALLDEVLQGWPPDQPSTPQK